MPRLAHTVPPPPAPVSACCRTPRYGRRLSAGPHALLRPRPDYKKEEQRTKRKGGRALSGPLTAATACFPFFSKPTADVPLGNPALPSASRLVSVRAAGEGCSACFGLLPRESDATGLRNRPQKQEQAFPVRFLHVPALALGQTAPYP